MSKGKKGILGFVFLVVSLICVNAETEDGLTYVKAPISSKNRQYNAITAKYKEIFIGYSSLDISFVSGIGEEVFAVDKAYYFYKKNGKLVLLGSFDKTGLYGKNGELLKAMPPVSPDYNLVGIASTFLTAPFSPGLVLRSKTDKNKLKETNPFVLIAVDTENDTLKVFEPVL